MYVEFWHVRLVPVSSRLKQTMQFGAGLLGVFLLLLLSSEPARSQACQFNGMKFEIAGLSCLPQKCSMIQQHIIIVGNKVLVSFGLGMFDQAGQTGQGRVYHLGRTIDPKTDPLNNTWRPELNEVATLFAELKGKTLSLVEHRSQFLSSGKIDSDYWFKIGIKFFGCTACEVYQYEHSGHARGLPATSTWRPYYCKITN